MSSAEQAEQALVPQAAVRIEPGDRVVVTGASGFIGSAVVRALASRGAHVVAVVEPGANQANLEGTEVERAIGDVRRAGDMAAVCKGARFVFHLAAVYRFWARQPRIFHEVNVEGTINVIEAVDQAGCERMVYTSTVGVLGLEGTAEGRPADETCWVDVAHLFGHYKRTKYVAEHEVLRAAARGLDVSLVLPTFPLGPRDAGPTPTGKLVVDFLNGKMPAFVDTAMNVVHVDDLATGHLLALEKGARGRSYVVGGENLSMEEILFRLARATGLEAPRRKVPKAMALAAGHLSQLVEGKVLGREPSVPLEAARMSSTQMIFSDARARSELGHRSRSATEALVDSARWFLDNGYVRPGRAGRIQLG